MEQQLAAALAKAEAAAAAQQLAMEEQMELVVADHADRASRLAELHQREEGGDRAAERAVKARAARASRSDNNDGAIRAYLARGGAGAVSDALPVGEGRVRHRALFGGCESNGADAGSSDTGSELRERRQRTATRLTGRILGAQAALWALWALWAMYM